MFPSPESFVIAPNSAQFVQRGAIGVSTAGAVRTPSETQPESVLRSMNTPPVSELAYVQKPLGGLKIVFARTSPLADSATSKNENWASEPRRKVRGRRRGELGDGPSRRRRAAKLALTAVPA